jgi:hypothetical protein
VDPKVGALSFYLDLDGSLVYPIILPGTCQILDSSPQVSHLEDLQEVWGAILSPFPL